MNSDLLASLDLDVVRTVAVPVLGLATLFWAIYVARRGWREGLAIRRVQFVRDYTDDFYSAEEIPKIAFAMDYGKYSFGEADLGTDREIELDRVLDYFNALGLAVHEGVIELEDLKKTTIGYLARVTYLHSDVRWYLKHIQDTDSLTGSTAFGYFRRLGELLESSHTK